MSSVPPDPYKALGVEKSADVSTIKSAYRKLVLKCHPDKVQDPTLKAVKQDEFQRVQQAYEVLVDETKRKAYDLDAKMRRMREEAGRYVPHQSPTPRTAPKDYAGFNVRTAEPPPSFKPGPPPSSYPYTGSSPLHSHSWDREMPCRTKSMYEDNRRARRTASYENSREVPKEERRRQKEDVEEAARVWQREREREREKKARAEREEKREKQRKDTDKRERERDRLRRQDQQDKSHSRKAYVEHFGDSDEERRTYSKKKPSTGGATGASSSKKATETPRRDRSARREDEPRAEVHAEPLPDFQSKIAIAASYISDQKRRGSKNTMPAAHFTEEPAYSPSPHFPEPEGGWNATTGSSPRPRRGSQEEKKSRGRVDEPDDDVQHFMASDRHPPRLPKSYSTTGAAIHVSNSSAPRGPPLGRAATMEPPRSMPAAPSAPPESGRAKPERRRRGSFEAADLDMRPRHSTDRVFHFTVDESSPIPRTGKSSYYRHGEEFYPPPRSKTTPFSSGPVYETKTYSNNDVVYSTVGHSSDRYPSSHSPFVGGA